MDDQHRKDQSNEELFEAFRILQETARECSDRAERERQAWARAESARLLRAPGSALSRVVQCLNGILAQWSGYDILLQGCARRLIADAQRESPGNEPLHAALHRVLVTLLHRPGATWTLRKKLEAYRDELFEFVRSQAAREQSVASGPEGFLSCSELARRHGVGQERLRKALERWRAHNFDGDWHEVAERRPNEPRYLYNAEAVGHVIERLLRE